MKNIGMATELQVNEILMELESVGCTVMRGSLCCTVQSSDGEKILSAARINRNRWHLRAVDGVLTVSTKGTEGIK